MKNQSSSHQKRLNHSLQQYLPRVDFDDYKDSYESEIQKSINFMGKEHKFFTQIKVRYLFEVVGRYLGKFSDLHVLDIGCGVGVTDLFLKNNFKKLYGVDIGKAIVKKAQKLNPEVIYKVYNGQRLPFPDNSMDITFAICVMHHVPPENLESFLDEMKRVTKNGGLILVFEHNPRNPLTRYAVDHCSLDEDAILLNMSKTKRLMRQRKMTLLENRYILFTPFTGYFFECLDRLLGWLPLGAQYYVVGKK